MARIHSIAQDAVLVAIDISKKRNDVLIQMPEWACAPWHTLDLALSRIYLSMA